MPLGSSRERRGMEGGAAGIIRGVGSERAVEAGVSNSAHRIVSTTTECRRAPCWLLSSSDSLARAAPLACADCSGIECSCCDSPAGALFACPLLLLPALPLPLLLLVLIVLPRERPRFCAGTNVTPPSLNCQPDAAEGPELSECRLIRDSRLSRPQTTVSACELMVFHF